MKAKGRQDSEAAQSVNARARREREKQLFVRVDLERQFSIESFKVLEATTFKETINPTDAEKCLILKDVLYLPKFAFNLLSDKYTLKKIGSVKPFQGLYILDLPTYFPINTSICAFVDSKASLWHQRLGDCGCFGRGFGYKGRSSNRGYGRRRIGCRGEEEKWVPVTKLFIAEEEWVLVMLAAVTKRRLWS
ncbi:cation/H(+) antiporter 18 [Cucumis melo var. makuwa]|uniref:Cation/H(+) antiporter 18 n=1 Tax=Cucumis melo var. makuwa TaxID=1194695 RepID=A0A5D3CD37_CUCMM|nr:cation/H(+) antiporter 18 [Cucumis melo var. makuwa]